MKKGLCFFAAEYEAKTPSVAELFSKHILGAGSERDALIKDFSDQSTILKGILTKVLEAEKVKDDEDA